MTDQSSWLIPGFVKAVRALGVDDPEAATVEANRLLSGWSTPERLFHNEKHLADIVSSLDEQSSNVHEPEVLVVAAWYHGAATYDPETRVLARLFNYSAAADQAIRSLTALGATAPAAARVGEIILMLVDLQAPEDDIDGCVFVAAVMSYLGAVPQRYRNIQKMLRAEIPSLDDHLYYRQRRAYVRNLLDRDDLFRSPLAREYEARARQNLTGELAQLDALFPQDEKVRSGLKTEHKTPSVFKAKSIRPVVRKSIMSSTGAGTHLGEAEDPANPAGRLNSGSLPLISSSDRLPVVSGGPGATVGTSAPTTTGNLPAVKSPLSDPSATVSSAGEPNGAIPPVPPTGATAVVKPITGELALPLSADRGLPVTIPSPDSSVDTDYREEEDQSTLETVGDVLSTLTMKKINYSPGNLNGSDSEKPLIKPVINAQNARLHGRGAPVYGQIEEDLEDSLIIRKGTDLAEAEALDLPLTVDEEDV